MLSFAKNDRGLRLASAAIIFLPLTAMICSMSRSTALDTIVVISWFVFAAIALIAFMYERAEESNE